jgi:RNA polymerase sigma-70 factor, ECF subfamily
VRVLPHPASALSALRAGVATGHRNDPSTKIFLLPALSSNCRRLNPSDLVTVEVPQTLDVSFTTSSFDVLIQGHRKMPEPTTSETADGELVNLAQAGQLDAFDALVSRYERRVYSLALRLLRHEQDAEDVTQQTFLSVLQNLGAFRHDASFATWLFRIATHAALKVIRKRKGLDTVSLEEATEETDGRDTIPHPEYIADWRQSPEELVHHNEIRRLLDDALATLAEKHRLVFLLRDVEELSIKETAEALGLSEANTKVRLLRARLQLRERLTRTLGDPRRRVMRADHGA